ncbi:MAG: radical SAM protein [Pseudomonadota bacterium]
MRVLLVNPYYPIDETPTPPLGIAFLAAALEAAGIAVQVLDYVVFPYSRKHLAAAIDRFCPDLLGVTAVTMTFAAAATVVADARIAAPDLFTVMGGPHVSFRAEETLNELSALDAVVLGEGEQTLVALAQALSGNRKLDSVSGMVFRRVDGALQRTPPRPLCPDINGLPMPARHLLPLGRYRALNLSISMTTSRGCPFQCIFCVGRKMVGAKVRYRDPAAVVDELEAITAMGFPQVNLADDLFTANADHCHAVCDEIIRRGLKVKWTSFARVDTVSVPVLRKMKAAGCLAVSFGLESGSPAILKTIRKKITVDQMTAAATMCTTAGVTPHGSFILGLPGETEATVAETLALGEKLEAMGVAYGFHLLAPFPGTEIREKAADYGIRILTDDWSRYHANLSIVDTGGVAPERLDDIATGWKRRFDAWLGDVARRMDTGEAAEDEAAQLTNLRRTVAVYDAMMAECLEKHGSWEAPGAVPVAALIDRVMPHQRRSREELTDAFTHAASLGLLQQTHTNGRVTWQWRDYL